MLKIRISEATIALIAFVMMFSLVSTTFAQGPSAVSQDPTNYWMAQNIRELTGPAGHPLASTPNARSFYNPLGAWNFYVYRGYTGPNDARPSPWYSYNQRYNQSGCNYNDASAAPQTAHIRWKYQYAPGTQYFTEEQWGFNFRQGPQNPVSDPASWTIGYGGYLVTGISESGGERLICIDEWNGKVVWERKMTNGSSPSWMLNSGGGPILYTTGSTVRGYGLMTGNLVDVRTYPRGMSYYYNNSKFGQASLGETEVFAGSGGVVYASQSGNAYCYSWSQPSTLIWGPTRAPGGIGQLVETADGGAVLIGASQQEGIVSGIDAITGELLWVNGLAGGTQDNQAGGFGMFYIPTNDGRFRALDARTGELVWISNEISASYWAEFRINVGDGAVMGCNRDGNVYCIDAFTGKLRWSFYAGPTPYEPYKSAYGSYGFHIQGIGGGNTKLGTGPGIYYAANGDESIGTVSQLPGSMMYALNMETGELMYKFPGCAISHDATGLVMDGIAIIENPVYSQYICFGKGPTQIDLATTKAQIVSGESTTITGRITDQSPAAPGTPCVSKDSMEAYMTYIHGGYPAPPAGLIKGVPVSLLAIDTANNVIDLGTVTSDSEGYFNLKWTPPKANERYQITASFTEDESYYPSWAITTLAVEGATATSTASGSIETALPAVSGMTTIIIAAIIVASVAVNAIVLLKIRKIKGGKEQ